MTYSGEIFPTWQEEMRNAVQDISTLCALLGLSETDLGVKKDSAFTLKVPHSYIARMKQGNPNDPLLLECLPQNQEDILQEGYSFDPLKEKEYVATPGILHKYAGRALIIVTEACPIHCRYCFRRHFPYQSSMLTGARLEKMIQYIQADHSISEIIFSGGDPLMLSDNKLEGIIQQIAAVPHVKTLRFHTRMPVLVPSRLTESLLSLLLQSRKNIVFVLHVNHPAALASDLLKKQLALFRREGLHFLNQAVLLKGINDSAQVQCLLSQKLFAIGVLPYYLHRLDRVHGAHHFAVSLEHSLAIYHAMMERLPGYLVPKFVQEQPGKRFKVPLFFQQGNADEDKNQSLGAHSSRY